MAKSKSKKKRAQDEEAQAVQASDDGKSDAHYPIKRLSKAMYEEELKRYQFELVRLQYWVKERSQRIVIIFEGRDAAGKGGTIRRIMEQMNPRGVRLVALGKPSDVERTQW